MALKENLEAVRNELSSQEQMMENFIKSERFIKKYKYYFLTFFGILIIYLTANFIINYNEEKKLQESNLIFSNLIKNPNNTKSLEELKIKNPNLYVIFLMSQSKDLNQSIELNINPLLKQIILAQNDENSIFLKDYNTLLKGYDFLKQNDFKNADIEFGKIPLNSPLWQLVNSLKHYQGIK
ncbi:hypothetical protein FPD38_06075 [Campylobacter volucris]|uniref:Uncharacterized protein n=1 Tax=Campylobacter volucris TaxID=1031542 RepID=A0A5C7E0L1_9BACT|nr:hypothetical protein [Campylobacter volucris]TXE86218.1 hypothetical protein FPD38_06075 [Campylobacter volucris]